MASGYYSPGSYASGYGESDEEKRREWAQLKRRVFWAVVIVAVLAGVIGLVVFLVSRDDGDGSSDEDKNKKPEDGPPGGGGDVPGSAPSPGGGQADGGTKQEGEGGAGKWIGIAAGAIVGAGLLGAGVYRLRGGSSAGGVGGNEQKQQLPGNPLSSPAPGSGSAEAEDSSGGGIFSRLSKRLSKGRSVSKPVAGARARSGTEEALDRIAARVGGMMGMIRKEGTHPDGTLENPLPSTEVPRLLKAISAYRKAQEEERELEREAEGIEKDKSYTWMYYADDGMEEERKKLMAEFARQSEGKYSFDPSKRILTETSSRRRVDNPAGLIGSYLRQKKLEEIERTKIKERQKQAAEKVRRLREEIGRLVKEESNGASSDFTALTALKGRLRDSADFTTLKHLLNGKELEERSMVVHYGDEVKVTNPGTGGSRSMFPVFQLLPGGQSGVQIHNALGLVPGALEAYKHLGEDVKKTLRVMKTGSNELKTGSNEFSLWFHDGEAWVKVLPEIRILRGGKKRVRILMLKNGSTHGGYKHPAFSDKAVKTFPISD